MKQPEVTAFFHRDSSTVTYVVGDGTHCAIIDPVLDFDAASGQARTTAADDLIAFIGRRGLTVSWILETHAHADHITAAPYLRKSLGGQIGIGADIRRVQQQFKTLLNLEDLAPNGAQFDRLFEDGAGFEIGALRASVIATPGHTPACVTYVVGDAAFVGDTIFMPDFGTARCDFPGGDASTLYASIQKILALPPQTRVFVGHDYAPGGRPHAWETTVAAEKRDNLHLRDGAEGFIRMRTERDANLPVPKLMYAAIQMNVRAGRPPAPEANGACYLKLPIEFPNRR